jgi:hypothetical protein
MIMKTIKLVFTIMAVAVAAIATGVEKPKVNVIPVSSDRAIVSIENENPAQFEVSIEAENGDMVYFKQTSEPVTDYRKMFDFKELEAGNYVFNLKVNDTKVSNEFSVSSKGIVVGESKMQYAPYFNFNNEVLQLSYLNFEQEPLTLKFYNSKGLVYKTELGKNFNVATGYDLSKLEQGAYTVVLSSFNNEFTYDLVK